MNDIGVLHDIILRLGGNATIDDIVKEYCRIHRMVIFPYYRKLVEKTLRKNSKYVRQNTANSAWEVYSDGQIEYLYTADKRYFSSPRETMFKVFNIRVGNAGGYFPVDEEHMAWFPKPWNDSWENTLSSDGKYWYEKPKTESADYQPDYKLRYVFGKDDKGWHFTGLFKVSEIAAEDKTRVYELIDDKVVVIKPRPYLIICRVTYMKYYDGITEFDTPYKGGSYVDVERDAGEKNNFHRNDDGYCYIFVETKRKGGQSEDSNEVRSILIEQINPEYKNRSSIDGVRVVLTAFSPKLQKNVVVGWYDDVTIYRERIVEADKTYMMKCTYENAHLIPDDKRFFEVPRAQGNAFGIGNSNFWYIQNTQAAKTYEMELTEYISSLI